MMKASEFIRAGLCLALIYGGALVMAQDVAQDAVAEENEAQGQDEDGGAPQAVLTQDKLFTPMVRVSNIRGRCEVYNPDVGSFKAALEGKLYPLGSTFRSTGESSMIVELSPQERVELGADTELVAKAAPDNDKARLLSLATGSFKTFLRENLPDGSLALELPNAFCRSVEGRGEYQLKNDADGEVLRFRTVTGAAELEGSFFHLTKLRAANIVEIQTAANGSFTRIKGVSGDFPIKLNKGEDDPVIYGMSPNAVVKIWRENAPVGGRTIVATLVVSPTGKAQHRFAYAVGRPGVATGELVSHEAPQADEDLPVLVTPEEDEETSENQAEAEPLSIF